MDKTDVAGALHEYEEAMTEFLTSVRARDGRSDFPLMQQLYAAGIEIGRLKLSWQASVGGVMTNSKLSTE
jgi:hypothetical protein